MKAIKFSLFLGLFITLFSATASASECVILLHGLVRTANSMNTLETELSEAGYYVANVDYPSRQYPVETLAETAISDGLVRCQEAAAWPVNFVTHSLGGILVRQYYKQHQPAGVHRVVMLAPPNKGSEIVDRLKNTAGFELINGPAGMQLGTQEGDLPGRLGPANFELGIIAGTRSINLILSTYLPNPDDGKVSVENTKLAGMCGFLVLPTTHTFIMRNDTVIREVKNFLKHGRFLHSAAKYYC